MKALRKSFLVMVVVVLAMGWAIWPVGAAQDTGEGMLVGRIAHVEGQLLRYVPEEKDWVATVKDAPFGLEDSLYSDAKGKAEFIMPNSTWVRIGGSTQIQLISLRTDVTEGDIASGMARFYNRNSQGIIRATSPFGYVVAAADTVFDLYVGDRSLEVIALKGKVDFILDRDQSRYEVTAGGPSIVSDGQQVTSGQGLVDADWDDWNSQRDQLWSKRTEVRGESVRYLPSNLHDEAYSLDENGRWEQVYYEGQSRRFWRPSVAVGWEPFTVGRWSVYYEDNCWVPYEPFGYVTHHYGNWVYANNFWYWAPPVVGVQVGVGPFLSIGFGWYPGRVGWIHSGVNVGWVPLAPFETYYTHRHWGPRSMVVNNVNITNIQINRYQYASRAVVVPQRDFYGVDNYQRVRLTNFDRSSITRDYRAVPVINNHVISNFSSMHNRYNFTTARVEHRPHDVVLDRISHNQQLTQKDRDINAHAIRQNMAGFHAGQPLSDARVESPRVTDRLVRPQDAGRPAGDLHLPQRELRAKSRTPAPIAVGPGRAIEGQTEHTGAERQPVEPGRERSSQGEHHVMPPTSGEGSGVTGPGAPHMGVIDGQRVRPPRPGEERHTVEPGQPGVSSGDGQRIRPARPGQEYQPAEPGQQRHTGEQGVPNKPSRVGGETPPADQGRIQSPLDNRKLHQPKGQQELQGPGGSQPGSTGQATDQGRRSHPPQLDSHPSADQADRAGKAPENRQQMQNLRGGRDAQSSHTEGGAVQTPGTGSQRTGPSGGSGEVRRPERTVTPSTEGSRNAVVPQTSEPQKLVTPPQQQQPHQQQRLQQEQQQQRLQQEQQQRSQREQQQREQQQHQQQRLQQEQQQQRLQQEQQQRSQREQQQREQQQHQQQRLQQEQQHQQRLQQEQQQRSQREQQQHQQQRLQQEQQQQQQQQRMQQQAPHRQKEPVVQPTEQPAGGVAAPQAGAGSHGGGHGQKGGGEGQQRGKGRPGDND